MCQVNPDSVPGKSELQVTSCQQVEVLIQADPGNSLFSAIGENQDEIIKHTIEGCLDLLGSPGLSWGNLR